MRTYSRQIWTALLIMANAMLSGCAPQQVAQSAHLQQTDHPALWQIEKHGHKAWLFGSIHVLPADYEWRSTLLDSALREAKLLVLEAQAAGDQQAASALFAQMAFAQGLVPLADRISPAQKPALERAIAASGLDRQAADHLKSWAAAIALAPRTDAAAGSAFSGIDAGLRLQFEAESKPVVGLESSNEQLGLFAHLAEADQRKMLAAVLNDGAGGDIEADIKAWQHGDAETALAASRQSFMKLPALRKLLLADRNARWAGQVDVLLEKNDAAFIAVGFAHFGGKYGLLKQLKRRGFTTTKLQ